MVARFVVALVALTLLSGCTTPNDSSPSSLPIPTATTATIVEPTTHTITGTVTLGITSAITSVSDRYGECQGASGYNDISVGTQVLLKDGDGDTLAVSQLSPGRITQREPSTTGSGYTFVNCQFAFTMTDVPDRPFYAFSVGRRGAPTYTHDDLAALGWHVAMTLG